MPSPTPQQKCGPENTSDAALAGVLLGFVAELQEALNELVTDLKEQGFDVPEVQPEEPSST